MSQYTGTRGERWRAGLVSCKTFFFFKQKTAYEMRISDWSSDVCSSDLIGGKATIASLAVTDKGTLGVMLDSGATGTGLQVTGNASFGDESKLALRLRSEEHTSELQSLMRISYAVFCLKKKKKHSSLLI